MDMILLYFYQQKRRENMAYCYFYFDLSEVVEQFDLTLEERGFFKDDRLPPSDFFNKALEHNLNWAIAVDTEQARREGLTREILMELREQCDRSISVFSGREFNVDLERGLSGDCDFLISPGRKFLSAGQDSFQNRCHIG